MELLILDPAVSIMDATGQMCLAYKHNRITMPCRITHTINLLFINPTVTLFYNKIATCDRGCISLNGICIYASWAIRPDGGIIGMSA